MNGKKITALWIVVSFFYTALRIVVSFFYTALRVVVSFFLKRLCVLWSAFFKNGFACCGQLISLAALRFVVSLLLKNRGRLRGLWSARDADKADQMFQSRRHLFFKPAMLIKADHDFQS